MLQPRPGRRGRPHGRPSDWAAIVSAGLALGLAGVVLWTTSFPGAPFVGVVAAVVLLALQVLSWGVRLDQGAPGWRDLTSPRRRSRLRLIGGCLVAAAVVAAAAGLPLKVRFAVSAEALDAAVASTPTPSAATGLDHVEAFPGTCPQRLGSFPIAECRSYRGAYLFLQSWNAVSDDAGFAYLPSGREAGGLDGLRHLSGPWYSWRLEPMGP